MTDTLDQLHHSPRSATATVGIIGAGQLARMTHQAATNLGIEVVVLASSPTDPAVTGGAQAQIGRYDDPAGLAALAARCQVVTLDHEHTPIPMLEELVAAGHTVHPNPHAAHLAHDKVAARTVLGAAGYPIPAFETVTAGDRAAVERFARTHGWPVVVKWPTGGYDGRGVHVCHGPDALPPAPPGHQERRWLLEAHVAIEAELAVVIARRPSGHWVAYPTVGTTQLDGICRELVMPAPVPPDIVRRATSLAASIAAGVDAVGILAVELFLTVDGELLVNELATRPHNSGHATIDACVTSQFENHVRAVLDWPLGDTALRAPAVATVNLIGPDHPVDLARSLPVAMEDPTIRIHLYRKQSQPGRKLGHVTAVADEHEEALDRARRAAAVLARS